MALLTENNRQYYEGAQGFVADGVLKEFIATFDTDLIWKSASPTSADYALNNFKLTKALLVHLEHTKKLLLVILL